jgi:hypothetical protein
MFCYTAQCAPISDAHDFYNSLHIFLRNLMHSFSIFSQRMLTEMDGQSQCFPTFSPWKVRKYLREFGWVLMDFLEYVLVGTKTA